MANSIAKLNTHKTTRINYNSGRKKMSKPSDSDFPQENECSESLWFLYWDKFIRVTLDPTKTPEDAGKKVHDLEVAFENLRQERKLKAGDRKLVKEANERLMRFTALRLKDAWDLKKSSQQTH